MYTKAFWKAAGERAVSTVAQTLVALLTIDGLVDIGSFDWASIGATGLLAGVLSVLKSLAAGSKDGNPSVGNQESTPELGG